MIASIALRKRKKIVIGSDFINHYILVIFVETVFFTELALKTVLHVLKSLSLQNYIQLVIFDVHYVRTFAVNQHHSLAQLFVNSKLPFMTLGSSRLIPNLSNIVHDFIRLLMIAASYYPR
jgi:hypothetical protein